MREDSYCKAGPVTVIRADGSAEVLPAYTERRLKRIHGGPPEISAGRRARILVSTHP